MSVKAILITLKCDGNVLSTLDVVRGCEPILIGRSHSCQLRTPPEDKSVSGRHARLFWKGGSLYLEDMGSSNGIYFNGSKLDRPIKVEPDGLYAIGSCLLVANKMERNSRRSRADGHKLEFMNGDRVNQTVAIKPRAGSSGDTFSIGLDPGCDLCLPDMMVSRRHAQLSVRPNGDCWIRDEGSSNGTYVNGEKLSTKERLLKDGDKISIAYLDLRFLDGGVKHTRVNIMTRIVLLLVTLGVIATGYVIWKFNPGRTTSADCRALASNAAEAERFDLAMIYMDEAILARNAEAEKMQNDVLRGQIRRWADTCKTWGEIRRDLEAGYIKDARIQLNSMTGDGYAWGWNQTSAVEMRKEAEFAREFIGLLTDTAAILSRAEKTVVSRESLSAAQRKVNDFVKSNSKRIKATPYLENAIKRLNGFVGRMRQIDEGLSRIDEALAGLSAGQPDIGAILGRLSASANDEKLPFGVRAHAKSMQPLCETFQRTLEFLEKEKTMIVDMDFNTVVQNSSKMPLPSKDDCAVLSVFSDFRSRLKRLHEQNIKNVSILVPMMRNLESAGIRPNEKGRLLGQITSQQTWEKVLSFDCFGGRFPLPSRVDPCGTYDEIVGIEYTHENLRNLPKPPGRQTSVVMNFVPKCQTAKAVFAQVRTFMQFFDRSELQGLKAGRLGRLYATCAQVLADRETITALLKRKSREAKSLRTKIVAGFYAEYFSDGLSSAEAELRALEMSFRSLQKKIAVLNERYETESDPEKRIKLRGEILAIGIPGMESVRMRWVEAASE